MTNKRITEYKIGSDPEFFLVDKDSREIISAIPFIPGDKFDPYQIPSLPEGHMIQTDNIMVEYCLPATTKPEELYRSYRDCVLYTNSIVPSHLEVHRQASGRINESQLTDPRANIIGCDPDFDVWKGGIQNEITYKEKWLKSCGGHVHIGYNDPDMNTSMNLIKALDIFLGISSVILDSDRERKKIYGKAGAYRLKSYGVEYRSLSNFWFENEDSVKLIFNGVKKAVDFINDDKLEKLTDKQEMEIQLCINTGDERLAYQLMCEFGLRTILEQIISIE